MMNTNQTTLIDIVKTWNISEKPEYRGFRCANCQQYKNKAWYHWVLTNTLRLPLHLCDDNCEAAFQEGRINIDPANHHEVKRESFGNTQSYSREAVKKFHEITAFWPENESPVLKVFTCDLCKKDLKIDPLDGVRKGWHVWWKMDDGVTLAELHFHKNCADSLSIF